MLQINKDFEPKADPNVREYELDVEKRFLEIVDGVKPFIVFPVVGSLKDLKVGDAIHLREKVGNKISGLQAWVTVTYCEVLNEIPTMVAALKIIAHNVSVVQLREHRKRGAMGSTE